MRVVLRVWDRAGNEFDLVEYKQHGIYQRDPRLIDGFDGKAMLIKDFPEIVRVECVVDFNHP